jgi:hypothetical protein
MNQCECSFDSIDRMEIMFIRDDSMGVFHVVPEAQATNASEAILSHVSTKPVRRVLIEKISERSVISLQCDGGSVVGDVPSWVLQELDRRELLPTMLGSYLRDMGYL